MFLHATHVPRLRHISYLSTRASADDCNGVGRPASRRLKKNTGSSLTNWQPPRGKTGRSATGSNCSIVKSQIELDRAKARVADLDRQLAGLQFACGEKDRLATDLAAAQSHLAAAQASAGDEDKLSAELATAQQRVADIQKQLADRDSELAGLRGTSLPKWQR
jgi:hypothetical protein